MSRAAWDHRGRGDASGERDRHRLLARQLRRLGVERDAPPSAAQWRAFLDSVQRTYEDADDGHELLQRSLAVSSEEMQELYDELERTSESSLALERDRLASLFAAIGDAVFVLDAAGTIEMVNPAAERLTQRTSGALVGCSMEEVLVGPGGDPSEVARAMPTRSERTRRTGAATIVSADGERLEVSWVASGYGASHDGGVVLVVHDVTPLRRTADALRRAEARTRSIVETAADAIITFGADRRVTSVNHAATAMFGRGRLGMHGVLVDELFEEPLGEVGDAAGTLRREVDAVRADGLTFPATVSITHTRLGGEPTSTALVRDESARKALEDALAHEASHDSLTGLPNRSVVTGTIARALEHGDGFAVLYVDLDGFKRVNDVHGHRRGDIVLVEAAKRLSGAVRGGDVLGRLGGDEFGVVCVGPAPLDSAVAVGGRIVEALSDPFTVEGHVFDLGSSVGVAVAGAEHSNADEILRDADAALYRAKAAGGGRIVVHDPEMRAWMERRIAVESELASAVHERALEVWFQPIVDTATGRMRRIEALARWRRVGVGWVPPSEFIPLAEELGLIGELGLHVLDEATAAAAVLCGVDGCERPGDCAVHVNVSVRQLDRQGFVDEVVEALDRSGLPPQRLVLEITESVVTADPGLTRDQLARLRGLGVRVAIDDFGTGFSSLWLLETLRPDVVKIDQSFVAALARDREPILMRGIVSLCRDLGAEVVAEGVETEEQRAVLAELGCHLAQGWLFSPAVSASELGGAAGGLRLVRDTDDQAG